MRVLKLKQTPMVAVVLSLTGGCAAQPPGPSDAVDQMDTVPEAVLAMADPDQDAATARILPNDNCYWYVHSGPVETTLLPLTTPNGNPICLPRET